MLQLGQLARQRLVGLQQLRDPTSHRGDLLILTGDALGLRADE
jgi:hypothetical protein